MGRKRINLFSPAGIAVLLLPLLLYPLALFPYMLWGVEPFAKLVRLALEGQSANAMWLAFNASRTVLFFWGFLAAVVVLISVVIAVFRVRPWYFIPLYIILMGSLCGVLALVFYRVSHQLLA